MSPGHEIFDHAPLVLVTAEVRLGYEPRLKQSDSLDAFGESVRKILPLLTRETVASFSAEPNAMPEVNPAIRASNRARTVSVAVNPTSLTLGATQYRDFESFLATFRTCLDGLVVAAPDASATRIGIRYIDEIRSPIPIETSRDWGRWLNASLLAPTDILGVSKPVEGISGSLLYHIDSDTRVLFRWGEAYGHSVVVSNENLRRPPVEEGKFFVLDVDSFQELPEAIELKPDMITTALDRLQGPAAEVFRSVITEDSRQLFRGDFVG